ncbi:glycerol kinase [Corynebacterium phocae]|uniref:Glycerol kinase n=1 Tax=Corynebacterium phocae TaxID=161895 RepID=A0A1L7D5T0_9CORY|nr:glycerol kinase GlpK [Corynebacterium phocae]APT93427.1 glycerol kinase [Corynebacterium phocae]KAA8721121.1 glycerol kinase GlpK [Corynebacterium phocae]
MGKKKYVAALDAGTTSTRTILFDHEGNICSIGQYEHEQIMPEPGWVEHDPMKLWQNARRSMARALTDIDADSSDVVALGITNQRETTIVWDKNTGEPVYNALVWQDMRTAKIARELATVDGQEDRDRWREKVGMGITTYPAGPRVKWILDNVEGARQRAEAGDLLFGTVDCWLVWNLTGGVDGGRHVTDVTNASRALLMDIHTLQWDEELCQAMDIPMSMLPEILPSVGDFGHTRDKGPLADVPIRGVLGDQQAATFGQACFEVGDTKNTYGTGLFLLQNTGTQPHISDNGLITTVAYQIEGQDPVYALEGSVAMGGSLIQWLRDQLAIVPTASAVEPMAREVKDNGGVYIVPAFSGLFAPRWRDDARGVIVGLTRYSNRNHLARAALEATAYQTREVIDAMVADSGTEITKLKVDGGMVANDLLMQFQADVLNSEVVRPVVTETTALGAAYAAGLAAGFWESLEELRELAREDKVWEPQMDRAEVAKLYRGWNRAVERSYDWVEDQE